MAVNSAKVAAGLSTAAAITSALAWIKSSKARAAPPGAGELVLPEEFLQLLVAIAASLDSIEQRLNEVAGQNINLSVQGYPSNVKAVRSFSKLCVIANTAYRADDMQVPEGMSLLVKSYTLNAAGSVVRVASSAADATNINSSWPLDVNEAVAYQVQNANQIYVSSTVAGSLVIFSAERVT
jgi:hypothetical protein